MRVGYLKNLTLYTHIFLCVYVCVCTHTRTYTHVQIHTHSARELLAGTSPTNLPADLPIDYDRVFLGGHRYLYVSFATLLGLFSFFSFFLFFPLFLRVSRRTQVLVGLFCHLVRSLLPPF